MSGAASWRWAVVALGLVLAGCRGARGRCTAADAPCSGRGTLAHGGRERTFLYHLPRGLGPGAPLVLSLHGRLGQGRSQAELTGFDAVADEAGFLVVYPDGVRRSWADGRGTTPAEEEGVDDVGFLLALIDHLVATHGLDARRVYVAGMSNGGMMSYRLACEHPERIAAIAPVGALLSEPLAARCQPARAVPLVAFVGTEDTLMPFTGGELSEGRGRVLSAEGTLATWARWSGCPGPPTTETQDRDPGDGTRVVRTAHTGCRDGAEVVLHAFEGGGHTWPGGQRYAPEARAGRTSQELDASRAAWAFFQRFRLP
jgi:polyhydroxybutyrate depolymerase